MKIIIRTNLIIILTLLPFSYLPAQTWEELTTKELEYYNLADYKTAIEYGEKAVIQAEKEFGKNDVRYCSSLYYLANICEIIGKYNDAEILLKEALYLVDKNAGKDDVHSIAILNSLSGISFVMGREDEAIKMTEQAIKIAKKYYGANDPVHYASLICGLGGVYIQMGKYKEAEKLLKQSKYIKKREFGENSLEYAYPLSILADLYEKTGRYDEAILLNTKVLKIKKELIGKNSISYIISLSSLAELYNTTGKYDESEKLFIEIIRKLKNIFGEVNPKYGTALFNLGWVYMNMGKYEVSKNYLLQAKNIYLQLIKSYFQYLSEKEKIQFINTLYYAYDIYLTLATKTNSYNFHKEVFDLSLFIKGLILSSTTDIKLNIIKYGNDFDLAQYKKLINIREIISYVNMLTKVETKNRGINLDSLITLSNGIEKNLNNKFEIFNSENNVNEIDFNQICLKLKQNEAAIQFINFQYYEKRWTDTTYYVALIVKPEYEYPQVVKLCTEKDLEQILSVSASYNSSYIKSKEISNKLYYLIWKPLEQYLSGVNTVYISPSGLFNRVSFYALSNDNNELLTDKYSIRYLTNLKDIVTNKPEQKVSEISNFNVAVFGGIIYDLDSISITANSLKFKKDEYTSRGVDLIFDDSVKISYSNNVNYFSNGKWDYLRGAKEEAVNITELFKNRNINVTLYTGTDASEDAVKSLNYANSPTVLHISTHGFFFPEPPKNYEQMQFQFGKNISFFKASDNPLFRSGLILAGANWVWSGNKPIENTEDGILTAYEVSNLYLSNTELVVLSACETGLGDIKGSEGVFGLQRAFKVAGAKSILMSLWEVPDKETVELMNLFYNNWLSGQTKYESLHNAQLEMRKKYDPYYWAAFVLVE